MRNGTSHSRSGQCKRGLRVIASMIDQSEERHITQTLHINKLVQGREGLNVVNCLLAALRPCQPCRISLLSNYSFVHSALSNCFIKL